MRVEPGREPRPGRRTEDPEYQRATFAGGCFWELEDAFHRAPGVVSVLCGYTGGNVDNPTYEEVCSGTREHAEAIQIVFDPRRVAYSQLLALFFHLHDPTQLDRQGPDIGPQYRSVVFYHDERQKAEAEAMVAQLEGAGQLSGPVVTRIELVGSFWPAEECHQRFMEKCRLDSRTE